MVEDFQLEVEWRGFELHPGTPAGGIDLRGRYGPKIDQMQAHLLQVARSFGVEMRVGSRMPCSRKALAIAEFARESGALFAWRDAAMDAHWRDGRDIESDVVLHELAQTVGLNGDAAVAASTNGDWLKVVNQMGEEAARWGVSAIPAWIFVPDGWVAGQASGPRPVRTLGCQPYEALAASCMRAGIARRAADF